MVWLTQLPVEVFGHDFDFSCTLVKVPNRCLCVEPLTRVLTGLVKFPGWIGICGIHHSVLERNEAVIWELA